MDGNKRKIKKRKEGKWYGQKKKEMGTKKDRRNGREDKKKMGEDRIFELKRQRKKEELKPERERAIN